jgi:hypothetical protein
VSFVRFRAPLQVRSHHIRFKLPSFSSNVFFYYTSNVIPALKQALLNFEVSLHLYRNICYVNNVPANCAVKSSIAIDFSSLVILKLLTTNYTAFGSNAIAGLIVLVR